MTYLDVRFENVRALTFFMIPVLRFENVVYRRSLLSMYSILIFTRPLVFLPLESGEFLGWLGEYLSSMISAELQSAAPPGIERFEKASYMSAELRFSPRCCPEPHELLDETADRQRLEVMEVGRLCRIPPAYNSEPPSPVRICISGIS